MGLKLMLEPGDKILMGDDTIISVLTTGKRPQIQIDAPQSVTLRHIKADPDKMFLNRRNKGA
jgi:hypothetical protein